MLTLDRNIITLLFAGYIGKLLIVGASFADAPIALILGSIYFLFFLKIKDNQIDELKQELMEQKKEIEKVAQTSSDVKSAMASLKISQGFKQVK